MTYLIPTIHPAYMLHSKVQLSDVIAMDLAKAWRLTTEEPKQREQYVVVHPSNPTPIDLLIRTALAWMNHWRAERCTVAIDIETSGLALFRCELYSIALSGVDGNDLGLGFTFHDMHTLPWEAEKVLVNGLRELLADADVPKAYHNSPYDKAVLAARGYQINGRTVDTQGLHLLVQPDIPHDLGFVGHQYLDVEPWKMSHEGTKMAHSRDIVELLVYNIKDAINTGKLIAPLCEDIYSRGMGPQVIAYQMDCADLATSMELVGLPINQLKRAELGQVLLKDVEKNIFELREMLHWPEFNPLNNKHRIAVYYDKRFGLNFTPGSFTPTGLPSTSYKTAKGQRSRADAPNPILENLEHPIVKRVTECQEWMMRYSAVYGKTGAFQKCLEADGRCHMKWNPVQLGGRFTSQPNCLSADTELLTTGGWLAFPEAARRGSRALQYDAETDTASIAPYTRYVIQEHTKWVSIQTDYLDILCTEDHRTLVEHQVQRDYLKVSKRETLPAAELATRGLHHSCIPVRAGEYTTGAVHVPLCSIILLCASQADGWRRAYGKGEAWEYRFTKKRKSSRLREALRALGGNAEWHEAPMHRAGRKPECVFYLKECAAKRFLDRHLIGADKRFGKWILDWDTPSLRLLVDEVTQWDGRADRRSEYSSVVRTNVDWIQIAAVLTGSRAGGVREFWGNVSVQPCYQLGTGQLKASSGFTLKHTDRKRTEPQGAYCATVPTGYIFIRRNGKACITGNCQNLRKSDREFVDPGPGRCLIVADKDQLELRIAACLCGVPELLAEMAKPDGDPHTMAARYVFGERFAYEPNPKTKKHLRDGMKNTVYAALYEASVRTVWRTVRERKELDSDMRAMLTLPFVNHVVHSYFGRFNFKAGHDAEWNRVQTQNYSLAYPIGIRRCFPDPTLATRNEISNWRVQRTGATYVTMAMLRIREELATGRYGNSHIIVHAHDEVCIDSEARFAEKIISMVDELFGSDILDGPAGSVKLTAKANAGQNWKAAKGG